MVVFIAQLGGWQLFPSFGDPYGIAPFVDRELGTMLPALGSPNDKTILNFIYTNDF